MKHSLWPIMVLGLLLCAWVAVLAERPAREIPAKSNLNPAVHRSPNQPGISVDPTRIGYPSSTPRGQAKVVTVTVTNTGDAVLDVTLGYVKTSVTGTDWLGLSTTSMAVPSGSPNTMTFDITLNKGGVLGSPGTSYALSGQVYLKSNAPAPDDSINIAIDNFIVGDSVVELPTWETIATSCTRLVVSNTGDVGRSGQGGVNMDFEALGGECDPLANVYLYDGGPIVIRKSGSNYILNTPLYQADLFTQKTFRPFASGPAGGPISGPGYTGYFTGMMINSDTSVGLTRTYYAPSFGSDTCNFIIEKTQFFGIGGPQFHVTLGEIDDWDIPSAVDHANTGHILFSKMATYQQGVDTSTNGCQPNANRLGSVAFLGMYTTQQHAADSCANDLNFYGAYIMLNDSLMKYDSLSNSAEGEYFWTRMRVFSGLTAPGVQNKDMHTVMTFQSDYTLTDTLTVYTALISIKNGTTSDLAASIDKAKAWVAARSPHCVNCCLANSADGRTGNIDCSPDKKVDISDLSCLIDRLYIWPETNCACCPANQNIDGDPSGGVDISDLSALIDYLYISFTLPAYCR